MKQYLAEFELGGVRFGFSVIARDWIEALACATAARADAIVVGVKTG